MTVGLRVKGELRKYFGAEALQISLADSATLADLLAAVGERWGGTLPAHLWDATAGCFRGPVVLMRDKTAVRDPQTRLLDGQEISLFKVLVGG